MSCWDQQMSRWAPEKLTRKGGDGPLSKVLAEMISISVSIERSKLSHPLQPIQQRKKTAICSSLSLFICLLLLERCIEQDWEASMKLNKDNIGSHIWRKGCNTRVPWCTCLEELAPFNRGYMCVPLSPSSGRKLEWVVYLERMFYFLFQRHQAENPGVQWTFLRGLWMPWRLERDCKLLLKRLSR